MLEERNKGEDVNTSCGRRVLGVVVRGYPADLQMWVDSAKTYGLYVVFSKSTRSNRLVIKEESW